MLENHSSISSITLILTGKWPAQIKLFLKWKGIISGKIKVASKAQVRRGRLHQIEVLAEALILVGRVISMLSLRMKVVSTILHSDPKEVSKAGDSAQDRIEEVPLTVSMEMGIKYPKRL